MTQKRSPVICPICGEKGNLTKRWVRSTHYPKYGSIDLIHLKHIEDVLLKQNPDSTLYKNIRESILKRVTGSQYRGTNKAGLIDKDWDEKSYWDNKYRTVSQKYFHLYVGHYDPDKYKEQMERYKKGERKSRPNGRKWCYIK